MPVAMDSMLTNKQYMLNKASLNRIRQKTELSIDWLMKML